MEGTFHVEGCRTNNVIEGWHRGIQGGLDGDHPSLWKFLAFLQTEEQTVVAAKDEQITAGQNTRHEKREQKSKSLRLKTIVDDYRNRPILDFLRGISYNIDLN